MEYSNVHIIDEERFNQLLEMLSSKDEGNSNLAVEILINSDTNDLNTCHYVENLALVSMFAAKPFSKIVEKYYTWLKQQPNWKKVQEAHLAFYDNLFNIDDELIYDYNEAGDLINIRVKE
jgi:hypothetical protein